VQEFLLTIHRLYVAFAVATTTVSTSVVIATSLPTRGGHGTPLIVKRAEDVVIVSALVSLLIGTFLCLERLYHDQQPPPFLVRWTLISGVVLLIDVLCAHAIQVASRTF
jgi:hypothetical protein